MKLPPLAALQFFNFAAQTESFVQAGRLLHVTHGAVSRQVRQLEESLGVTLFERRNRAIFLNESGRRLYQLTAPFFEDLRQTVLDLQQPSRDEVLVVSCEPTIAMKWLIPRLADFHSQHPGIQVQLLTAGGAVNFARTGVDVAVRRDDFYWGEGIHSATLCEEWVGPLCTPGLWHGQEALDGLCLLHSRTRPQAWDHWLRLRGITLAQSTGQDFEHFYLSTQAAAAGLGVCLASALMVEDELRAGQLLAPLGFDKDGSRYCLLAARPFADSAKATAFLHWITAQMQASTQRLLGP
ncbi:LysR substrate-binding domain-containing protein [Pseudomonas cremoricolorata]|uniref:LysR substrate-binding domain-containing protein n=1 Tax=Pseudomonas cremoricolorata TaxID=157783 RepID=UPI00041323A9|nr:LysR substrate-binding domain-containing protein [Pseudomonas cremoricolorata]